MRTKKSYPYEIKGTFRPDQGFSKVGEVKKTSHSGRMKRIEKQLHSGETRYGLYYTGC